MYCTSGRTVSFYIFSFDDISSQRNTGTGYEGYLEVVIFPPKLNAARSNPSQYKPFDLRLRRKTERHNNIECGATEI